MLRITARKGAYFGLDAGVPLSFDGPLPSGSTDSTIAPAIKDRNRVIDLFRARDGYTDSTGAAVAATNPTLKIVLVVHIDRPGIVKPFINGLVTLDETPGVAGSYPLVSNEANVNATVVTTGTHGAGVDAVLATSAPTTAPCSTSCSTGARRRLDLRGGPPAHGDPQLRRRGRRAVRGRPGRLVVPTFLGAGGNLPAN